MELARDKCGMGMPCENKKSKCKNKNYIEKIKKWKRGMGEEITNFELRIQRGGRLPRLTA